jgi:hypothetical protein
LSGEAVWDEVLGVVAASSENHAERFDRPLGDPSTNPVKSGIHFENGFLSAKTATVGADQLP